MRAHELFENAVSFPTGTLNNLFHVGSLNISDKGKNSLEGAGLSVSQHPNAWRGIARGMVGGDTFKVTKPGNQFLDYHSTTPEHRQTMEQWAIAQGLAVPQTFFRVSYYDDECDGNMSFLCATREEADEENESYDGDIDEYHSTRGTPKLEARCRVQGGLMDDPIQLIATVYADDVLNLDGVWWQDRLDPLNYSAPRGVIFPDRVSTFQYEKLENPLASGEGDDDDEYGEEEDEEEY